MAVLATRSIYTAAYRWYWLDSANRTFSRIPPTVTARGFSICACILTGPAETAEVELHVVSLVLTRNDKFIFKLTTKVVRLAIIDRYAVDMTTLSVSVANILIVVVGHLDIGKKI